MNRLVTTLLCTISLVTPLQAMRCNQIVPQNKTTTSQSYGDDSITTVHLAQVKILDYKQTIFWSEKLYQEDITEREIEYYVKRGADLNYIDPSGTHNPVPIFYAYDNSEQGLKNMKKLLELGANANIKYSTFTPLSVAVAKNYTEMAKLLIPYVKIIESEREANNRSMKLDSVFFSNNTELLQLLITEKKITLAETLKQYIDHLDVCDNPSPNILECLLTKGAESTLIVQKIGDKIFPVPAPNLLKSLEVLCKHGMVVNHPAMQHLRNIRDAHQKAIQKYIVHNAENCLLKKYPEYAYAQNKQQPQ